MSKFLSGRQSNLKLGVSGYTESKTVLQTTGKVGIGTTDAQSYSLFVVGDTNITGVVSATQFIGDGSNLANTGATLSAAAGTQRLIVSSLTSGTMVDAATDSDLTFNAATNTLNTDNLVVAGNLTVSGDQTILNVTQLEVEDINIGIASASSKLNNAQLNGAGITIHGSQGDKTLTWDNSNSRLGFNTDLYVPKVETAHAQITGGISTDGYDTGNPFELMRADGNGGWEWATVPGIFSVNNILNGFNVQEEGLIVGTAGSIHTLDFRGINVTAAAGPQPNGIATVTFSTRPSFDETYINGLTTAGRLVVSGVSTFSGEIDANGRIVAAATNNVIPFLYSNLGDLPSAVSFHGAFAHVHGTGKAYYAHAANWYELVNKESNGVVGTGTETYNIGNTQITGTANVGSAITMYGSTGIVSATAFYGDGSNLSNTGATLSAASGVQRLVVTDLTSGTMVDASTDGDLTFTASNNTLTVPRINVSVGATFGGTITAGSSEGVVGQYLRHVGAGVTWANFPTLRTTSTIIATDGQTVFGFTHNTNFLDVFVNGVKLSSSEYTSDGSNVTLSVGSFAGDVVELHSYNTASTYGSGGGGGGISLTDLSVTTAGSPLQLGALAYNNSNGVFTFTPPDVEGQSRQALSVGTANSPLQIGAISYNNGTGVFTYTPPDLSSYLTSYTETDTLADVTGRGATTSSNLTFGGTVDFNGAVDVNAHVEFKGGSGSSSLYIYDENSINLGSNNDARLIYNNTGNIVKFERNGSAGEIEIDAAPVTLKHSDSTKLQTSSTGVTVTGTLAATAVTGSGSGLTGLTGASAATYGGASVSPQITVDANGRITGITNVSIAGGGGGGGSSIIVQDNQSLVGAAGTIDFGTGLSVSSISAGVATVTAAGITTHDVNTNTLNVVGVSTFNGNVNLSDNDELRLGNSNDLRIYHGGFGRIISTGGLTISADDDINLDIGTNVGDTVNIRGGSGSSETLATFAVHGSVDLYYDAAKKFETTGVGVTVFGTTQTQQLNVSGISTFNGNINLNAANVVLGLSGGSSDDRLKFHNSEIYQDTSSFKIISNTGGIVLRGGGTSSWSNASGAEDYIVATENGSVSLYHDNSKKLETTNSGVTVTGTASATTFSGSGANLTNLPAANITGTLPAISGANLTNLPSPTPADTDVQVTYDVSSNGSSGYRFTGPGYSGADDNPDIYLVRGQRYRFINGTGSGHPFRIQSDTSGTAYTDGVSGSQSGTQDFNVQHDAPVRLYYQCTIHSGMIGNIYVVGASDWRMTDVATNATPNIFTNLNVGIGSEIPATTLDVAGTGQFKNNGSALKIESDPGNNYTQVEFKNDGGSFFVGRENSAGNWFATGSNYASILRSDGAYPLIFSVNGAQRLRIDSSGNMGLGTNSPNNQSGYTSLTLNNATSGSIIDLRRNDVALSGGRLVGFENEFGLESRSQSSNSQISFYVNNAYAGRFTSDGLCFGSDTAAANALDDYEEGTFTFTITAGVTSPTYTSTAGTYTKIGNCVTFTARMQVASGTANGSQVRMGGLPFASSSTLNSGGASFSYLGNINGNGDIPLAFIPKNHTEIILYGQNGGTWNGDRGNNIISSTLHIHGHYYV